jgi:transcription elongation GreA/GreB family factor
MKKVGVGATVELQDLVSESRTITLTVVRPDSADPRKGWISHEAPVGAAVVGHRVGDRVTAKTPAGEKTYEIVAVRIR